MCLRRRGFSPELFSQSSGLKALLRRDAESKLLLGGINTDAVFTQASEYTMSNAR